MRYNQKILVCESLDTVILLLNFKCSWVSNSKCQVKKLIIEQIRKCNTNTYIGARHLGLKMQVSFDTSWFPLNLGLLDIGTKECHCQGFGLPPSCSFCDKSVTDQIGLTTTYQEEAWDNIDYWAKCGIM